MNPITPVRTRRTTTAMMMIIMTIDLSVGQRTNKLKIVDQGWPTVFWLANNSYNDMYKISDACQSVVILSVNQVSNDIVKMNYNLF